MRSGTIAIVVAAGITTPSFGATPSVRTGSYSFVDLALEGAAYVNSSGINNSNEIVGGYYDMKGNQSGFLYNGSKFSNIKYKKPYNTDLDNFSINNKGQISGFFSDNDCHVQVFLDTNGTFDVIDITPYYVWNCPEGTGSIALNDFGELVGFFNGGPSFLLSPGGNSTVSVPGAVTTQAFAINNLGQIVGRYFTNTSLNSAFLYSNGTFIDISVPGAGTDFPGTGTHPVSINNVGQVAGYFYDKSGNMHGFVYDITSKEFTKIDEPNDIQTSIGGINDNGVVTGVAGNSSGTHIFIANKSARTPEILFNGENIAKEYTSPIAATSSSNSSAVVGQQVALTAVLPPSYGTVASQSWLIDGNPIGGFSASPSSFQTGQVVPVAVSHSTVTFYWTEPTATRSKAQSYSVTYRYTLTNHKQGTIETSFTVSGAPSSDGASAQYGKPNADWIYSTKKGKNLFMGFGNPSSLPTGITFRTPQDTGGGTFSWVQLLLQDTRDANTLLLHLHCTALPGLDAGISDSDPVPSYPYGFDNDSTTQTSDSPAISLLNQNKTASRSFTAQMFLMWNPNIPASISLPIGSVTWGFSETTHTNDSRLGWSTPLVKTIPLPNPSINSDKTHFPLWNNVAIEKCK